MRRALICGATGQDGAYLSRFLLGRGYEVWGTSRGVHGNGPTNLQKLGLESRVQLIKMDPNVRSDVEFAISQSEPNEIYFFAGQSSVGESFERPAETIEGIIRGALNLLETVRVCLPRARMYNASSSECFGDLKGRPADENTPFAPVSPYGAAKAAVHSLVVTYRDVYGLFACNGILFNHESPLRPDQFVTKKVTAAAVEIARGSNFTLRLGRLDVVRDWGWAPEFVEAMWKMLQMTEPSDFVVGTGLSVSLESFVEASFSAVGLEWRAHTAVDEGLGRRADISWSGANPARAASELGWVADVRMPELAGRMVRAIQSGEF